MLGMTPAGTAVVCVVAILAAVLVLGLVIGAVRDVQVAKHTGQPPTPRDVRRRESTVKHP